MFVHNTGRPRLLALRHAQVDSLAHCHRRSRAELTLLLLLLELLLCVEVHPLKPERFVPPPERHIFIRHVL